MKKMNMCIRTIVLILTLLLTCPFSSMAQQVSDTEWWQISDQVFRPEELDQMLAPIALYPDRLLAQVLAAATYPQSIAAADRFVNDNPGARGQDLIYAAKYTNWSPSVKAMLLFPDVLDMMNQYLDWTTRLGNAFLTQQRDVMDSIQRLRHMAYEQGRFTTTRELVTRFDPQTQVIFIEPSNPDMVYVPVYDPGVVYGTWRYPSYPPYRYYSPRYSNSSAYSNSSTLSFLTGVLVGSAMGWGGWNFDWRNHRSNVQVDPYNTFVRSSYTSPELFQISSASGPTVAYDTQFRRAAGYRDYTTAQRSGSAGGGQRSSGLTTTRSGVSGSRVVRQVQAQSSAPTVSAPNVSTAQPQASSVELKGNARTPRPAASSPVKGAVKPTERVTANGGVGNGANVRAAGVRGQSSPQSSHSAGASNAGVVNKGVNGASKGGGSTVSQAAQTAKSEGLKGKDLAGKVHEAIDTRKEAKDTLKAETKTNVKDTTEKLKKEKELKGKDAKENNQ